jgi:hypothetical protein
VLRTVAYKEDEVIAAERPLQYDITSYISLYVVELKAPTYGYKQSGLTRF